MSPSSTPRPDPDGQTPLSGKERAERRPTRIRRASPGDALFFLALALAVSIWMGWWLHRLTAWNGVRQAGLILFITVIAAALWRAGRILVRWWRRRAS